MKSPARSIVGLAWQGWSHWIIVDQAVTGERVLGEFSTVIALAANRANGVPFYHSADLEGRAYHEAN